MFMCLCQIHRENTQFKMLNLKIDGLRLTFGSSHVDERGTFRRLFDIIEINDKYALNEAQVNLSVNPEVGTFRGMHFQSSGMPEHKSVSVVSGEVYIVVVDLRKTSASYLQQHAQVLSSKINQTLFIPAGCATGWLSLKADTTLHYLMFSRYEDNIYSGFRWDDSFFGIEWPEKPKLISKQDNSWPDFKTIT